MTAVLTILLRFFNKALLYRFMPPGRMDWFFCDFLWHRLERRNACCIALRAKDWT